MMILALFHVFMLVTICHAHFGPILPNDIFSPKDYQGFVTRENLVFTIQAVYTGANKVTAYLSTTKRSEVHKHDVRMY